MFIQTIKPPIKLLITGIPGSGKTSFGDYLKYDHNFFHVDVEKRDPIEPMLGDYVITWGFVPDSFGSIALINSLKEEGFKHIWFDGNRKASKRNYLRRTRKKNRPINESLSLWNRQLNKINDTKIIEQLKPIVINPFNIFGTFKNQNKLFKQIKRKLNEQ